MCHSHKSQHREITAGSCRRGLYFELFTWMNRALTLRRMEVHIKPETESRLHELATKSGRAADDLVEDALAGYLGEIAAAREMLDQRYDDVATKSVTTIEGEEA